MINPRDIDITAYDYPLPQERIAVHPLAQRDACKLLVRKPDGSLEHHIFSNLPVLLPQDSLLVYNNTRVINARILMHKESGAAIEIFCLEPKEPADYEQSFSSTGSQGCSWHCLVGNSKRWKSGPLQRKLLMEGKEITLTAVREEKSDAGSVVSFTWDDDRVSFSRIIECAGVIPIPPYLNRETEESDKSDYQTVFSRIQGSVAAPTAGLHFTPEVLDGLAKRGVPHLEVTLHVGAGTFKPVTTDTVGEHQMHAEFIAVPRKVIQELAETDRQIIAVGTTSVRTLESLYHIGCLIHSGNWDGEVPQWYPYSQERPALTRQEAIREILRYMDVKGIDTLTADTRIIIAPGYTYRMVSGMVTNFHQPQSTLLLLVSAFMGPKWRDMYTAALDTDYRFLSYGDACLLLR
ncbi:MAG: S-adenosylmethionine:tRNA ribosyltransferase-isomerase [Muribaculaceae bacterium]|nr:S-adenosylmethionine:tRNA ribosyltransferase-isomerase [Muribaculaceae bacterium]